MFILPYFHGKRKGSKIHALHLFLGKGGLQLLDIPCKAEDFCKENEMPVLEVYQAQDISFAKVDAATIDLSGFYTFHDSALQSEDPVDLWKTFLWVGDANEDPWSVNQQLKPIHLNGKSLFTLLETILRHDALPM
jgi:hypothetical protein